MKSTLSKKELWTNLSNYNFDTLVPQHLWDHVTKLFGSDPSKNAFASKLAGKLFWETDFALYAIDEYKRFVYLGLVADFMVTPSKIIDQVWHEHILFTRAYRDFCDNVICYDFDHFPELVPHDNQSDIYKVQFQKTLDLYRHEFNEEPPAEIWGTTKFNTIRTSNPNIMPQTNTRVITRGGMGIHSAGMGMHGGGGGMGMMNNDPMMNNGQGILNDLPAYMMMQDMLDNMQNQQQQNQQQQDYNNQQNQQQNYNNQQNPNQQDYNNQQQDDFTPGSQMQQDSTGINHDYQDNQDNNDQDDYQNSDSQDTSSDDSSYETADVSDDGGGDSSSCGSGDSGCSSGCSSCGGGD